MNRRTKARIHARVDLMYTPHRVSLLRIVEGIDKGDLASCSFQTLCGAVRAAARELNRSIVIVDGQEEISAATPVVVDVSADA
jgi:hypothetical protein